MGGNIKWGAVVLSALTIAAAYVVPRYTKSVPASLVALVVLTLVTVVLKLEVIPLIKQVAKEKSLPTIDLYSALGNHAEMFPDKIHPNAAGAALMAKTIQAALLGK